MWRLCATTIPPVLLNLVPQCPCSSVVLGGSEAVEAFRPGVLGVYSPRVHHAGLVEHAGRAIYVLGSFYLSFDSKYNDWRVVGSLADATAENKGAIYSYSGDSALCPTDASDWRVQVVGSGWVTTHGISVTCASSPPPPLLPSLSPPLSPSCSPPMLPPSPPYVTIDERGGVHSGQSTFFSREEFEQAKHPEEVRCASDEENADNDASLVIDSVSGRRKSSESEFYQSDCSKTFNNPSTLYSPERGSVYTVQLVIYVVTNGATDT